jgi:hypothetical protein
MTTHVKDGGVWRTLRSDGFAANVGTTPRPIQEAYAHAAGSWRTVHITDATGPVAPPTATATWSPSGLQVAWTEPGDADYSFVTIGVYHYGESTLRHYANVGKGTTSWLSTYAPYWTILRIELTPYDLLGNAGTKRVIHSMDHLGGARGRVPSPIEFYSNSSGTWRNGQWREDIWADKYYVYQGSSVSGKSEGAYFYGDQVYDTLRGTTITAASWQYVRTNSTGLGGAIEPEIYQSTIASRADAFSKFGAKTTAPGVCRNGACTPYNSVALPSAWYAPMVTPGAPNRFRSVVLSSDDTTLQGYIGNVSESYMAMYPGYARPIANNTYVPGRLVIAHTG